MDKREVVFHYTILDKKELTAIHEKLTKKALDSANKAYAPYSGFSVGAAVLLDDGEIVVGNNQENAAFPSGLCAERVALFWANANFPDKKVLSMAVVAVKDNQITEMPISPCGACRQVMAEVASRFSKPFEVLLVGEEKIYRVENSNDFFPLSFTSSDL